MLNNFYAQWKKIWYMPLPFCFLSNIVLLLLMFDGVWTVQLHHCHYLATHFPNNRLIWFIEDMASVDRVVNIVETCPWPAEINPDSLTSVACLLQAGRKIWCYWSNRNAQHGERTKLLSWLSRCDSLFFSSRAPFCATQMRWTHDHFQKFVIQRKSPRNNRHHASTIVDFHNHTK